MSLVLVVLVKNIKAVVAKVDLKKVYWHNETHPLA